MEAAGGAEDEEEDKGGDAGWMKGLRPDIPDAPIEEADDVDDDMGPVDDDMGPVEKAASTGDSTSVHVDTKCPRAWQRTQRASAAPCA